eukprot:12405503-Karenia_brevis.AAC.1
MMISKCKYPGDNKIDEFSATLRKIIITAMILIDIKLTIPRKVGAVPICLGTTFTRCLPIERIHRYVRPNLVSGSTIIPRIFLTGQIAP